MSDIHDEDAQEIAAALVRAWWAAHVRPGVPPTEAARAALVDRVADVIAPLLSVARPGAECEECDEHGVHGCGLRHGDCMEGVAAGRHLG